jgi:Uma2 family endonuclease
VDVTLAELERLPEDGNRYDLLDGELIRMSPAGEEHGRIAAELLRRLANHAIERGLGRVYAAETGFQLEPGRTTVLGPDVAFVRSRRVQRRRSYVPTPPDLAVEVRSPNDRRRLVMEKVGRYLAAGSVLVWLVEPARRTVTVFSAGQPPRILGATDELDGGDCLPGFRLPLADLFTDA